MIVALAGRRIDAADTEAPRFPLENVAAVRQRVREMLAAYRATAIVSGAACGADLIALSEAGALGLRRRVVLPFDRARFRESSVIDRPGDWGPLYDELLDELETSGDIVIIPLVNGSDPYLAGNRAILDEAFTLSTRIDDTVCAALVWDGKSRGDEDVTGEFAAEARRRGLPVIEVPTL